MKSIATTKLARLAVAVSVIGCSLGLAAAGCGGSGKSDTTSSPKTRAATPSTTTRTATPPAFRPYVATVRRGYTQLADVVHRFEGNCYTSAPEFDGCRAAAVSGTSVTQTFQRNLGSAAVPSQLYRADGDMRRGLRMLRDMFARLSIAAKARNAEAVERAILRFETPAFDLLNGAGFKIKFRAKTAPFPFFQA
jgi:hypothetical protein